MTDRTPRAAKQLGNWFERHRGFWEQAFDRLHDYVEQQERGPKKDRRDGGEGTTERKKKH